MISIQHCFQSKNFVTNITVKTKLMNPFVNVEEGNGNVPQMENALMTTKFVTRVTKAVTVSIVQTRKKTFVPMFGTVPKTG